MTKDDMMPPRPEFTKQISFGQVVQIVVLLGGFWGGYVLLQKQAEDNARAIADARSERTALEIRLRTVETQQARADERFSSILGYLSRIDSRLERIEQRE